MHKNTPSQLFQGGSEYACVQIAPGNVLRHHGKNLIRYFEFLNGSRIICFSLIISEKLHWQHAFKKLEETDLSLLIWYNTHTPWIATSTIETNRNHHHFFIRVPILGYILVHSVYKTHVLVAIVELIWLMFLNIILSTLFQHWTNLSGSQDLGEAILISLLSF